MIEGFGILSQRLSVNAMVLSQKNTTRLLAGLIALLFAIAFQAVDWPGLFESLYGYPMIDREVYTRQITTYDLKIDYKDSFSSIEYFTSEWLWAYLISYITRDLGLGHETVFLIITFLVLWRFGHEIINRTGFYYLPFLLNPLVVDYAYSQLRIALAIAILSFVWRGQRGKAITIATYIICMSIHTSTILFAVMHFAAHFFQSRDRRSLIALIMLGALIAAMIGPLREMILSSIGDRRAEYIDMSSSTLYLMFWILMFGLMVYDWKNTLSSLDGRYALIILSIVGVNVLTGGYSTRFLAAAFPSLLIAMAEFRSKPISLLFVLFIPYAVMQWFFWLRIV